MRHFKGNTLLIELMIVLMFFALSQAIILQVFAKAQQLNADTSLLNAALLRTENAAETLAVSDDPEASLFSLGFEKTADGYQTSDDKGYRLNAVISRFTQPSGVLTTVELSAAQGDKQLFTLPAIRYQGVNKP